MFYVALIVLLLCLLITLYFHHKYICNEIEELKELIKNIKLSDSNNSITKSLHSNNEPKKDTIKPIDELIESNEEIKQSLKPNYSKFINVPIIEHKEDNIINNSSDQLNKPIDKLPNDQMIKESNNENINNNENISNKANDDVINKSDDKQLPSLIDSEDDLVIPKIINPNSFEYPTLNELEQQVLNQITNEINNGISIINESLGIPEINKHPRVEEVNYEEPINDNKDNNKNNNKDNNKDDNKNEIINYEINENIINDVLNDIKMQEVNNQNDIVKDEEVKDDIKETKDNISDSVIKESLNENQEVKESNESIKPKIDPEVINDLLNGNYKYLQLVKKCKDLGIDVAKKKKEEIFKILKSYL